MANRRHFLKTISAGTIGLSGWLNTGGCISNAAMNDTISNLYIGTYTSGESKGIYKYRFDRSTGELKAGGLVAVSENPSFLAIHPSGNWLYAVNELMSYDGEVSGAVSAFSIAPDTGELLLLNQQSSKGGAPCHISIDATGRWVLLANYGGGNVVVYPIGDGGVLGEPASIVKHVGSSINASRQKAPHAHSITLDPHNKRAIAADLGIDRLLTYDLNLETGELTPAAESYSATKAGAGPRHFAFHPNAAHAFVINELDSSLSSLTYDAATGGFEELDTVSTLPADFSGESWCADVHVSDDGRFVYASNRGHDSIVVAAFDETTGKLNVVGHQSTLGQWPRNFVLNPGGDYLLVANQKSDSIVVFKIDRDSGMPAPTGQRIEVPSPVCLKFA